mgnify:CR=1 FL=1
MARVLVTGANGFVGAAVCRHLKARGWTVRGSLRRAGGALPEGVEAVETGDIDGNSDWSAALAGVDAVVHCAARVHVLRETSANPLADFRRVNVAASRRLAEQAQAAGVGHFVFLSSIGAVRAESEPAAANPYQVSKLEAEAALNELAGSGKMVLVMLRPPLIYGPGAPGNFARLAKLVVAGRPLPLANINNARSLLFVGNLTAAIEAALSCSISPKGPLALADGTKLSTPDLVRRIGEACGRPARLFRFPSGLLQLGGRILGRGPAVAALTGNLTVDNTQICRTLGWSPDYTVEQGLAITFREQGQCQST